MKEEQNDPPVDYCSTCIHWKKKQAELGYSNFTGFCTNPKFKFDTKNGRLIGVVDRQNPIDRASKGNPYHDIETVNPNEAFVCVSRYILVTEEKFGCIYHQNPDKPEN